MKQKQATNRWRMLNMFLSVVAIAIAVVALMRKPDTPAAAESPQPTAVVSAEQSVQDNTNEDRDATILMLTRSLNATVSSSLHYSPSTSTHTASCLPVPDPACMDLSFIIIKARR